MNNTIFDKEPPDYIKKELEYFKVYNYLDKYIEDFVTKERNLSYSDKENSKTIWMFWRQGVEEAPRLVRKCIDSIYRNKPDDWSLKILTEKNILNYVEMPQYILEKYHKGVISTTHFSDLLRLELLSAYGGCWIDATVYCSGKIPEYMLDGSMFMFKQTLLSQHIIKNSSWWMYSNKEEPIVKDTKNLLYKYWENEDYLINYFLLHIAISKIIDINPVNKKTFYEIPHVCNSNAHVLWGKMGLRFDEKQWEIIKNNTTIHKLSYKKKFIQGDIDNFYTALLEGRLR